MRISGFLIAKKKSQRFFSTYFSHFSSIQIIVSYYVLMTFISYLLFCLPFFRKPDVHVPFIYLLFMAISTISVTGLSTFDIHSVFNTRGLLLLELLFQIGGLGIMMISTSFLIRSKHRISLKQRQLIMTDMNQPNLSGIVRLIRITFSIILWFQLVFGILFSLYFYFSGYYTQWSKEIFYGFYQSISTVTNSGFDITGDSIMAFSTDYLFLISIMFLIFIGGIGFPVLMEIREWLFFILFIGGTFFIYLLEKDNLFSHSSGFQQWIYSMFYSMTTRNAGMQLNPLNEFQLPTLILFSLLMFIGCSPSSVGGGIRTTTIAIIGLYVYSFLKGEDKINIFGRRISEEDVKKSIVVFMLSAMMCFFLFCF